jgi:serine/threonine-protein kinase
VIVRRWRGRADPTSAAALGRRTGARLAVYGSLLRSGTDSVRLAVTVLDVARRHALGEIEVRGALANMDHLTDSVTIGILSALGRSRPMGAMRRTSLGARSLPALKAFLQAEQHFRRGAWDSAQVYGEQAIALDTTFALAYDMVGRAIGFRVNRPPGLDPFHYVLRAGKLNHGLAPRDSLLLLGDSLGAALGHGNPPNPSRDAPSPSLGKRRLAVLEQTVERYPDDPWAWHELGEVRYHLGGWLVPSGGWQAALAAFERSIALDSLFGPAYIHPIELSYAMGDTAHAQRLLAAALRVDLQCTQCPGLRAVQRLLALPDSAAQAQVLDTLSADELRVAYVTVRFWKEPAELAVRILRRLEPLDSGWAQSNLTRTLALRGHLRQAIALGDSTGPTWPILFAEGALLGAVPAERASATFRTWIRERSSWSLLALAWWSGRRDVSALRKFVGLIESTAPAEHSSAGRSPDDSAWSVQVSAIARAHLALARRDTAAALRAYEPLRTGPCPWWCQGDQLTMARLLVARNRLPEAARILSAPSTLESDFEPRPSDVLWYLERGRVAERLDDRARALEAYGYVAAAWRRPDPELEPYAAEARAGLTRLSAEPGR